MKIFISAKLEPTIILDFPSEASALRDSGAF